jgi:hypothetical protein
LPLIATALMVHYDGSYVPVGLLIIFCALVSLVALSFVKDKTGADLDA